MKRALFFTLLHVIGNTLLSQNMVVNSGFETWDKISRPAGWIHIENCMKDSLSAFSGKYSCLHSGGTSSASDLGQTISVYPGKDYNMSLHFRTSITSSGNGARIWCYWKDKEGNSINDPETDAILRPSKYMKSEVWQKFSINIKAPPEATALYLEVRTYPNSITFWDEISFEERIVTNISEISFSEIVLYPNPSVDYLNINSKYLMQHIIIQTVNGITVRSSDFPEIEKTSIPVSWLKDGLYIVKIKVSGRWIIRKFIKQS
jgi:hypothetical protein